jgi:hypothetical protein
MVKCRIQVGVLCSAIVIAACGGSDDNAIKGGAIAGMGDPLGNSGSSASGSTGASTANNATVGANAGRAAGASAGASGRMMAMSSGGAGSVGTTTSNGGTPASNGGAPASNGGTPASNGGAPASNGGAPASNGGAPAPSGDWPTADPTTNGPFMTVTENNVGPDMAFTMFRPMMLTKQHPVITWGNGTSTTPPTYRGLLTRYASHGFIVIASNSMNVAQGTPKPMIQGVDWVIEQNGNAMSPLYQHVDVNHIGATGHSQGAGAASSTASDPRMTTVAPIEGARIVPGSHGPALLLCGGMDTTIPCASAMSSLGSAQFPAMFASNLAATHTNWISPTSGPGMAFASATTAWFRVFLMGDVSLKSWFYGPSCKMCTDTATWSVMQKMLD